MVEQRGTKQQPAERRRPSDDLIAAPPVSATETVDAITSDPGHVSDGGSPEQAAADAAPDAPPRGVTEFGQGGPPARLNDPSGALPPDPERDEL